MRAHLRIAVSGRTCISRTVILIRNQYIDCVTLASPRKTAAFGDGFEYHFSICIDREMV